MDVWTSASIFAFNPIMSCASHNNKHLKYFNQTFSVLKRKRKRKRHIDLNLKTLHYISIPHFILKPHKYGYI